MNKKPPGNRESNMKQSLEQGYAWNQLGNSGKPKAHNPLRTKTKAREKARLEAKKGKFKGKNKVLSHGPHAHLERRHFQGSAKTGPTNMKVHHTHGRKVSHAKKEGNLKPSGYRYQSKFKQRQAAQQPQKQETSKPAPTPPRTPTPNRGRTR